MGLFTTTNVHNHETIESGPSEVHIHEHRAATDDSIRLANEFRDKVKRDIVKQAIIDNNIVNAISVCYVDNPSLKSNRINTHIRFKLNGEEFYFEKDLRMEVMENNEEYLGRIYEAVSQQIALLIISKMRHLEDLFYK